MQFVNDPKLDAILQTISDLIQFRTVDGQFDTFENVVQYVQNFFADSNLFINVLRFNRYPALVITQNPTKNPQFFLQGHLDVVDGSPEQFVPKIHDNKLYGRGSVDMKGFDAVAMHLLRDFALSQKNVNAGLMLTFDEEIGGANGAEQLAKMGYLPKILINGDGGYNYAVIHAEKGILKIKISTQSESGRHPYPWDGQNAFDLLVRDYRKIMNLFEEQRLATENNNWFTTYSSYDVIVKNEPSFAPHYAEMKVNIYFTENVSAEEMFQRIKQVVQFGKVEKISASERVYLQKNDRHVLAMRKIMQQNFGRNIEVRTENGSSDARFFTNHDIPIIIVKMPGQDHHGPNEHLYVQDIMPMYYSLKEFIEKFAKQESKKQNELLEQH